MTIKLIAADKERLTNLLERVCNICCVAAMSGTLPTESDKAIPQASGGYWLRKGDTIDFFPAVNNYKGFIEAESGTEMTIRLHYRYDRQENSWEVATGKLLFAIFENAHQVDRLEIVED